MAPIAAARTRCRRRVRSRSSDRTADHGDRANGVRLPALATTLETLAREGFDAFYEGEIGDRQVRDARRGRLADRPRRSASARLDVG